ncbi:zf-TFIIB domain-containing protein [candidate division KSB1 bacterium]|nr:zf-TFIIB domain-containing protein [candidate division KSB1 bacterium]
MPIKPSEQEEAYFARLEFERRQKIEAEKQAKMKQMDRRRLQELHHMHCPKCGMQLIEIDYSGIKIEECSGCRGVWLDASELQQIIDLEQNSLRKFFSIFQ